MKVIKIADTVLHKPTQEEWVVGAIDKDKVYWLGYPFGGYGQLNDCELIESVSIGDTYDMINQLASMKGHEFPIMNAKRILEEEEKSRG